MTPASDWGAESDGSRASLRRSPCQRLHRGWGSSRADDSLLQRCHHFRDEFLPAVQYSEQRLLARGRVFDIVTLSGEACVDEIRRLRDWRRKRLRIEESDTFEGIDDARKARISKRAAKDGGQVAGKAVLRKVAERVPVGDTFEGESS